MIIKKQAGNRSGFLLLALLVCGALMLLSAFPAQAAAPTTEVHVVKYASDGVTVLNETTVNYSWMRDNLPVMDADNLYTTNYTHHYFQGPTFDENNIWDPAEEVNVESRDYGAVAGTDIKDLCELVGGMSPGDEVKIKSPDGFHKWFDYATTYNDHGNETLDSKQGPMVLAWYNGEESITGDPQGVGYPDTGYFEGMRLHFFADNSTNPGKKHVFGLWDMHECLAEEYWHYYQYPNAPSSSGLSVKWIGSILIYSTETPIRTWYVDDSGGADFTTIQDAVNASNNGDTIIVRDGAYSENVNVSKSITIASDNGSAAVAVTAAGPTTPVFDVNADGVTIEGFNVSGPTNEHVAGIELVDANSCMIVNNTCCGGCYNGIHLGGTATGNTVTRNYCHNNWKRGISLRDTATGNFVSENTCENNADDEICIKDQPHDNVIWLNNFMGSVECLTDNTYHSPTPLTYPYNGSTHTSYLGNYYSGYTGVDTSPEDGIGDTPYNFSGSSYRDAYPLMAPFEQYLESTLASITVSPALAVLYVDETKQFAATARDQYGSPLPNVTYTWSSSNESVGTITAATGLFTAITPGTSTITATNSTINGTTTVTVLPVPIAVWGPYVTKTTTNATVVNWKTVNATSGVVSYATDAYYQAYSGYEHALEDTNEIHLHHLNITNLTPGTLYHYQLTVEGKSTDDRTFRTFPTTGSFSFIVYGDSQEPQGDPDITQLNRHKLVADRIAEEENVTFVLHAGDLVNDGGDLEEWDRFFEAARAMMSTTTFYPTLGNHEYSNFGGAPGDPEQNYYDAFGVPEWYSFNCGDAHFTVLDSNDEADVNAETTWLLNDLATTYATWKFVSFHHPPYSSSDKNYGGWLDLRDLWSPLFRANGVNAVFNGHVHAYERLKADGIHYVVAGTGGGPLYDLREPRIPESQNSLEWTLGYVKITIDADTEQATLEMIAVANLSSGEVVLYPPRTVFETFTFGPGLCGDVNSDGKVTMGDGRLVYLHVIYGAEAYPLECSS